MGAAGAACCAVTSGAAAAPVAPDTPISSFTLPAGLTFDGVPTISASEGVVGWSQPTPSGRWGLRLATSTDGVLDHTFDAQPWPIDVSIGTVKGRAEVLWSHCPKTSSAPARRIADGCDVVRLSRVDVKGSTQRVGGAYTAKFSEFAPSRDGNRMVFSRREVGSTRAFTVQRDVSRGRNHTLASGPVGSCSLSACRKTGFIAGGADETSVDGSRFAMRWRSFGGDANLGISDNDQVLGGTITGSTSKLTLKAGLPGLISGTCSERRYSSVQQLGTTVQMVRHAYDCDSSPTFAEDVVLRYAADGTVTKYADPSGRRIISAAADGDRLWLIREARAYDPAQVTGEPAPCSEAVGGCDVVAVDAPAFTAAS